MEPHEVLEWKARLRHADNEWKNAGLIPDENAQGNPQHHIMKFLDAYRGDHDPVLQGAMEPVDQMAGNLTFSIINSMVAQMSAKDPDPILRPLGGPAADENARRRAWLNERQVEAIFKERRYKRETDLALLCAVLTGFGVVRHGFTPEVEFEDDNGKIIARHKNQTPDLPWIQFLRPWQIRIDPMVNSFDPNGEPRWVAFHNLYYESQVRKNQNLIFRRDLAPTFHQDMRLKEHRKGQLDRNGPDAVPMYEEWVIYDADTRKFFGISPGSDKLIREEQDWPFEWGQLPYSWLAFNEQIDSPFPIAFPQMFKDEQQLYNKVWTIINALVSRIRRVIFVNQSSVDDAEMAKFVDPESLVEFILTSGNAGEAAKEIGFGSIPGELIGLLFQLKEQIREVLGVSSFDRGQRANVETAAEANNIAAGGAVARGRTQERFEQFLGNVIKTSHRTFLQSEDAREFTIPIIGHENLQFLDASDQELGFINVSLDDLQGEFSYDVKLDSTLRTDPNTEFARFATTFNLLGGIQSQMTAQEAAHKKAWELGGQNAEEMVVGAKVAEQMTKDAQGQGEEGQTPGDAIPAAAQNSVTNLQPILGGG